MSYEFDHEQARKRKNSESKYILDVDVENGSISKEDVTWNAGVFSSSSYCRTKKKENSDVLTTIELQR